MDVQVIGQQWAVHLPLPDLRRSRDTASRAARRHARPPARHLARRRPLVLGLRARRQGRRQPRRRQRRLRAAEGPADASSIRCAELCGLWHGYMYDTGQVVPPAKFKTWIEAAARALRADRAVPAAVRHLVPPRADPPRRMRLRRLIGFHVGTGIVLGIGGWYLGWFVGHHIHGREHRLLRATPTRTTSRSSSATSSARSASSPGSASSTTRSPAWPAGRPRCRAKDARSRRATSAWRPTTRWSGSSTCGASGSSSSSAGLNAMLIRFELLRPNHQVFPAGQYLTLVGLHGTMMMGIMSSAVLGPFANYLVPIMIGARRMAFPRIEALTLLAADGGRRDPDDDDLLRRLPDGLDGLRAADRPGERRHGLLHRLLRARRDLDDACSG